MRTKLTITTVLVLLAAGTAGAIAVGSGDDEDPSATGPGADRARAAALKLLPGGRANSVERDGEDGATWEVEVTKADGNTVDVRLDDRYRVVVVEDDDESPDDGE
jgi:uncharacterized membrane protein YkoI